MATIKVKAAPEVGNEFVPYRNVPNVRFPNTLAPIGRALQGLGAAFAKAQATGMVAEEAKWDTEYYKLKQDLEHNLREMARQAPADGKAFSSNYGKFFLERTGQFLEQVPEQLKPKYAKLLARDQINLEQRVYNFETGLHDESLKRSAEDLVKTGENKALEAPLDTGETLKEILQKIDEMPLPAAEKEVMKRKARERVETAAMRSAAKGTYADIWLDRLHKIEGTGKNPRSSAVGHFQFIDSTWLTMVQKYAPQIYQTYDRKTILGMRKNYAFARQMARAYLNEIVVYLNRKGVPVDGASVRLGWFLGPEGAVQLLRKPSGMPVEQALPAAVLKANPFLRKYKTAGGVVEWARRQMGKSGKDPFPNVPVETKVAMLGQQNAIWQNMAVADQNAIAGQFNDTFENIYETVVGMEPDQAVKHITDLLQSGKLDKVVGEKVEKLLEEVNRKRWKSVEREYVVGVWTGKYGPEVLQKLDEQGAPLSVMQSVRKALKEASGKNANPKLAKWRADIALGDVSEKTVSEIEAAIKKSKNNPYSTIKVSDLISVLNEAKKALKNKDADKVEEVFKRNFELAAKGKLPKSDLDQLIGILPPDKFKTIRTEVEKHERMKVKLAEEEAKQIDENLARSLESGAITYEDAVRYATDVGLEDTIARRRMYRQAYSVWEKKENGLKQIDALNMKLEAGVPIDPMADKKPLNEWYASQEGPQHIMLRDMDWFYQHLLPVAEKGAIPPDAASHIAGLVLSDKQDTFWRGIQMMTALAEKSPQILNRQFGEEVMKDWQVAGTMLQYGLDRQTAFDRIKAIREARMTGNLKPMEREAEELTSQVDVEAIIDKLDVSGEFDKRVAAGQNGPMLLQSYRRLFKMFYPYFGNEEQTDVAVGQALSRLWGTWESKHNEPGSLWGYATRFMLLPPNKVYPPGPDGKFTWLDKWLDGVLEKYKKQYEGQRVVLLADRTSMEEWRTRKPVTYRGYIVSKSGNIYPLPERLRPPAQAKEQSAAQALENELRKKAIENDLADRLLNPLNLFNLLGQ